MTVSTLRPNATTSNTGAVTGGGGVASTALSDDSDASFITCDPGELFEVGIGDLSLPAGAVIKTVSLRLRTRNIAGTTQWRARLLNIASGVVSISWSTPTTTVWAAASSASLTDALVDATTLLVEQSGPAPAAAFYEAYVDVTYVAKPVVTPTLPTGTITNTNLPTVTWSNTLDSDGGAQTNVSVLIYDQATYSAGGFTPGVTTALGASVSLVSASQSVQVDELLADGTYRAYVRIAQTVNGQLHRSDWAFTEFIVSVALPGTPTLNATADSANGRITLAITDNPAASTSTDRVEVQRSLDAGTTWEALRTLDGGYIDVPFVAAVGVFSDTADGTTHNAVLPAPTGGILADDLLIAVAGMDGTPTFTWPSDWTELKDEAGNGSAVRAGVAWKRAVGGESGTIVVTTSASEGGGIQILCVRDASTTTAPEVSTGVSSAAANANPDSLNPAGWGTEPTLWIAAMVNDGNVAVTAGPSGYYEFLNTRWANASGAGVATASFLSLAASADPGAFTHTLEDSRAFTIGVRPRNANLTVYDYEAPNGVATSYRARTLHDYSGVFAASAWATDSDTWTSTSWWLKHPHRPDLNMAVSRIRSFQTVQRAGRQGVFQPLGATHAIVVSDTRGPKTGTVTIWLDSFAEQAALDELLDTVATLMLQSPDGEGGPGYVRFADQDRQRIVDWADASSVFDALTFTQVAQPAGDVVAWPS